MRSALHCLLLFSALWTLSLCGTRLINVVTERKNWTEAQEYCRENFTDLLTIRSEKNVNSIKAVLSNNSGHLWIGLRQKPGVTNQTWIWSDGSKSSYNDWGFAQPDNPVGDICVQIWSEIGFKWNDIHCCWQEPFICYEDAPIILINQNKTWREALKYCRENHVDLVSVETEKVQDWVKIISKTASTDNVWMGLRHTSTLSFWFWVSGNSICYQNWASGHGTGEEDCSNGERTGAIQAGSKQWVSLPETQTLNFICTTV